jgi:L-asparaginase/beta-aspartyl-peptidase (threonine type)
VLAVHGGAGPLRAVPPDRLVRATEVLASSLRAGFAVVAGGGPALDAVVASVSVLEDDEDFNAGRGSVLTDTGAVEMDAAVADGRRRRIGAVAAVSEVRNPVELARAVLEEGSSVLIAGSAALAWAERLGLECEEPSYFITARRRRQLQGGTAPPQGTVGAVARDAKGDLAAATSTGGTPGKAPGRVGDSPVPGAGTWADNATCAVSATGDGEALLLAAFAHEVDARMRLLGADLEEACGAALVVVAEHGGTGGCVALTAAGRLAMPFTSHGMFRGWVDADGRAEVGALSDRLERVLLR